MLEDRDYMNPDRNGGGSSRGSSGMSCLIAIIAFNIIMYLAVPPGSAAQEHLLLSSEAVNKLELWCFATAVFLHGGFEHIFFNMLGLYIFGIMLAPRIGALKFLGLFLFSGILGNVVFYVMNIGSPFALLGASGAVMGVIIATAMLMPNLPMGILFIPYPVKLRTLAIVYLALDIFGQVTSAFGPVAYLAHIGGFLAGIIYMKIFLRHEIVWDPFGFLIRKRSAVTTAYGGDGKDSGPRGFRVVYDGREKPVSQAELDRLLDKLSRVGINGLSQEEQDTLRRAREELLRNRGR